MVIELFLVVIGLLVGTFGIIIGIYSYIDAKHFQKIEKECARLRMVIRYLKNFHKPYKPLGRLA